MRLLQGLESRTGLLPVRSALPPSFARNVTSLCKYYNIFLLGLQHYFNVLRLFNAAHPSTEPLTRPGNRIFIVIDVIRVQIVDGI